MNHFIIGKPVASEYAPIYQKYVCLVQGDDVIRALTNEIDRSLALLRSISDGDSLRRYAPDKWSIREVIGHVIDTERIFAYRALRFARNDVTDLAGFDQDKYVASARFYARTWHSLLLELELVRRSNVQMFEGLESDAWGRIGISNDAAMSVRALAWMIAGHELHHISIIRQKYLV